MHIATHEFTRLADYRTAAAGNFVSDVQALDNHRLVVIERDGGRGLAAIFRNVYVVDLDQTGADGGVVKTLVVELAAIPDPDLVSVPALHTGDVGLGNPFRVTCESIEAVHVISHARLLLDSAPIVERLLALLPTSEGEMLTHVVDFFNNVLCLRDRHMTRRLVDDFRVLPPLVDALRCAVDSDDRTMTLRCLWSVRHVLIVGSAEAARDPREINPYIEPLDWLGVFELVDPLQQSADAEVAQAATHVFSYFIPNDCD